MYWSLSRTIDLQDERLIVDKIQTLVQLLKLNSSQVIRERVEKEWSSHKIERFYVKVMDQNGSSIAESLDFNTISSNVFDGLKTIDFMELSKLNQPYSKKIQESDGRTIKVQLVRIHSFENQVIQIALDRTSEENILKQFRSLLFLILSFALVISTVIGKKIAQKGLKPVSDIAEMASLVRSTTLHRRLVLKRVPSELKTLVSTFNEMLTHLDDSFARLSRFSQDIAHDLRTPINILRGELEVALGRPRTISEYQVTLGSCLEECAKLSRLIDNLLFLARSENPSAQLEIKTVNIKNEVLNLVDFFETTAHEAGLKFEVSILDNLEIQVDKSLLQRALVNLISNSINYSEKKGGVISICAIATENHVLIQVTDQGVGIALQNLPRVFDRFFRVDESRTSQLVAGTGLGLSIVKGIMNLHRGDVRIESTFGLGTTVSLEFPIH